MGVPIRGGDLLAQPTRTRLLALLRERRRPVATGALAGGLGLHRVITRGPVESVAPETRVVGFEPRDPDLAGCLVRVRGPLAREAGE